MARQVFFLDRDGTVNVDDGYVHRREDFQLIEGAVEAIKRLGDSGAAIAVVTNQSGIAAGLYTENDVHLLHDFMRGQIEEQGAGLDAVAFCPHARDDGCDCRKPLIGMAGQIEAQLGETIDYSSSWMVGDKPSDVGFGLALGMRTALIRSRYWKDEDLTETPDLVVDSLLEFARKICGP